MPKGNKTGLGTAWRIFEVSMKLPGLTSSNVNNKEREMCSHPVNYVDTLYCNIWDLLVGGFVCSSFYAHDVSCLSITGLTTCGIHLSYRMDMNWVKWGIEMILRFVWRFPLCKIKIGGYNVWGDNELVRNWLPLKLNGFLIADIITNLGRQLNCMEIIASIMYADLLLKKECLSWL